MRKSLISLGLLLLGAFSIVSFSAHSESLPPYPFPKTSLKPQTIQVDKSRKLFDLARRENENLHWDECLAEKALRRARSMADKGYFSHSDPTTGRNPAWNLVVRCHKCRYAGENLTKGYQSAEVTHRALMESPSHRQNLMNPNFNLVGIGCYDFICVQLFAGF